jgi:hypothetical protein
MSDPAQVVEVESFGDPSGEQLVDHAMCHRRPLARTRWRAPAQHRAESDSELISLDGP